MTPNDPTERVHISMGPGLPDVLAKDLRVDDTIVGKRGRQDARQPDRKASFRQQRLKLERRIGMILTDKFESILECDDDRGIHPGIGRFPQLIDELLV
jgi:hypothetical protein